MNEPVIKTRLQEAVKTAMKSQDKMRLSILRMVMAAVKQREVDERIELDDTQVLAILDKMVKERRDAMKQFEAGKRQDLVDKETFDISVIQEFLPTALSAEEIVAMVSNTIIEVGAHSMQDMGKVMGKLKPLMQGRADLGEVSVLVKKHLENK